MKENSTSKNLLVCTAQLFHFPPFFFCFIPLYFVFALVSSGISLEPHSRRLVESPTLVLCSLCKLTLATGVALASLADVSERRRRWSGSTKAVSIDETDEGTEIEDSEAMVEDPKLKVREEGREWE